MASRLSATKQLARSRSLYGPHRPSHLRLSLTISLSLLVVAMVTHIGVTLGLNHAVVWPGLEGAERFRYLGLALTAAGMVAVVDATFVLVARRRRGERPSPTADSGQVPVQLGFQRVPGRIILWAAATSAALASGAVFMAWPPWAIALAAILPFVPPCLFEGIWKYHHYGFLSIFIGIGLLQLGHLGEHTAQLFQLVIYHGDLRMAHGVFGALDFEAVHFAWDTAAWLGAGVLVCRFRFNRWLWISLAFASVHQVEHVYLFSLSRLDLGFYLRGGFAGIMGQGGLVGSPLGRPYVHFLYNYFVVGSMLLGLWDQCRYEYDRYAASART